MPTVPNLRTAVTDALRPLLPTGWKIVPYSTNLDTISQTVVMLQLESVERHAAAPKGARLISYSLLVIEPKTQPGPADDALDHKLLQLLDAIDATPGLNWTKANRVATDTNPAFDITLTFDSITPAA